MSSYRPISTEIAAPTTVSGATTLSGANRVRVTNTTSATQVLTVLEPTDAVIGTMTLLPSEVFTLSKREDHKVYAESSNVRLTSITYPAI